MAEPSSSGGGNSGGGDEVRPSHEIEVPGTSIDDQTVGGGSSSTGARVSSSDSGNGGHVMETGDSGHRRAPMEAGRTPVDLGSVGPRVDRLDYRSSIEGLVVTGGGLGGVGGSSSSGGGGNQSRQPPRDPASGKDPMVEDEPQRKAHVERVEFVPPVRSSGHKPIMSSDLAEFVGEAALARLMEESPTVVAAVLAAREERLQQIAWANEEERLRREAENFVREAETAERAQEEEPWVHEAVVTLAEFIQ